MILENNIREQFIGADNSGNRMWLCLAVNRTEQTIRKWFSDANHDYSNTEYSAIIKVVKKAEKRKNKQTTI